MNKKSNIEKLEDIEFFAETELYFGDESLGLFLLKALASIERQFSDVDDIVLRAKEAVNKHFEKLKTN
ncbi:hypothetical protein D3C80_2138400 [compost metagenome]